MLPAAAIATVLLAGCAMVGPDFTTPPAGINPSWLTSGESRVAEDPTNNGEWWRSFNDPALNRLIEIGYAQNLPLQIAGARVLQSRAQLAVTVGDATRRPSRRWARSSGRGECPRAVRSRGQRLAA